MKCPKKMQMSNLQQLLEQQAELDEAIEKTRREERAATLRVVKLLVAQHGLTAADLRTQAAPKKQFRPVKYRHPSTGESWTGRGRQPRWLRSALLNGSKLEDFAV